MDRSIIPRIGTFFILVGCGLLVLFTGSIFAGRFNFPYLLLAAASLLLGFTFRRTAPRPEPTRFSGIRRLKQRSRQRREEKQDKQEKQSERDQKK